jgi:hypothetical protein
MYPNKELEHHQVIVNGPNSRRETITETVQTEPQEFRLSPGVMALIGGLALLALLLTLYVVNNKNANEEANRQAMLEASQMNKDQAVTPVAAPPAQQPVIIQQPVPQQPPVVVQQPAQVAGTEKSSLLDDVTIQDAATKRLTDETDLASVAVTVIDGKAILTGTVETQELKAKAERIVRAVRGVKTVDNKIVL